MIEDGRTIGKKTDSDIRGYQEIPVTATTWRDYFKIFNLPQRMKGLDILDIGSGASDFTAKCVELGANAYAVDPMYMDPSVFRSRAREHVEALKNSSDREYYRDSNTAMQRCIDSMRRFPERYIASSADSLPFQDKQFDHIVSAASILGYLDVDGAKFIQATEEALRVLKDGGQLQLFPLTSTTFYSGVSELDARRKAHLQWFNWISSNAEVSINIENGGNPQINKVVITKSDL